MEHNPVKRAVQTIGGPDAQVSAAVMRVGLIAGVSVTTVYNWLNAGCIQQAKHAVLVAEATMAAGKPISVRELAGLPPRVTSGGPKGRKKFHLDGVAFQKKARVGVASLVRVEPANGARAAVG